MNFAVEHIGLAARDTVPLKDWYMRVLDAREVFNDGKSPPAFLLEIAGGPVAFAHDGLRQGVIGAMRKRIAVDHQQGPPLAFCFSR